MFCTFTILSRQTLARLAFGRRLRSCPLRSYPFIARYSKVSCPVSITERLLALFASPKEYCSPVLRRIVPTGNGAYFHKSLGISYSTIRDEFKKYISPFVNNPGDYCYIASNQVALLRTVVS